MPEVRRDVLGYFYYTLKSDEQDSPIKQALNNGKSHIAGANKGKFRR